jgi:hypothetical protein
MAPGFQVVLQKCDSGEWIQQTKRALALHFHYTGHAIFAIR